MPAAQDNTPFLWTAGRGGWRRLVAHVLIRLLVLSPLPPHLQLGAALFPLSLLWPLLASAELAREPQEKAAEPRQGRGCVFPLSDGATGVSGSGQEGYEPQRLFDLSDPTDLQLLGEDYVHAPPSDLAIDPVRNLAAVSQGWKLAYIYHPDGYYQVVSSPANVNLYDVTTEPPRWVGVTSLTQGVLDGMPDRVVLKGGKLYAASSKKGLQIADVERMQANFVPEGTPEHSAMLANLGLNGSGVGLEYVVTIPVPNDAGQPAYLNDLEVPDLNWNGTTQPILLAVGNKLGLVVADPGAAAVVQRAALPDVKYGDAVLTGTVNSTSIALVGGTLQGGGRLWVLSLAPLATRQAPTLLGMLDVPAGITDLLFLDATTVIAATDTGIAYVISLADPTNPVKTDELLNVGSRLALTDSNLLLSTSGSFIVNPNDPLRGLHATALDQITIIKRADPAAVGLDNLSIEPQRLTYQSIPKPEEVVSSQLEVLWGDDVRLRLAAPLDEGGRGELLLPAGTAYPPPPANLRTPETTVRAQLVVNPLEPVRPRPMPKVLTADRFDVEPSEPDEVSAWPADALDVEALNPAIQARLAGDPDYQPPLLIWSAAPAGWLMSPLQEAAKSGIYGGRFEVPVGRGQYTLELRDMTGRVLGRTAPLTGKPGPAFIASIRAEPVNQPGGVAGKIPADGTSTVQVIVEGIKDYNDNPVEDGTPVDWQVDSEDGQVLAKRTFTVSGRSQVTYKAGIERTTARVRAHVHKESWWTDIEQTEIRLDLEELPAEPPADRRFRLTASSDGGRPAYGTPVSWSQYYGLLSFTDGLDEDGESTASWAEPVNSRLKWAYVWVMASVGRTIRPKGFARPARAPNGMRLEVTSHRLVGDEPGNPDAPDSPDSPQIPTSTRVMVTEGPPLSRVRLSLGTPSEPIVGAKVSLRLDEIESGETPDWYGGPGAQVAGSVSVAMSGGPAGEPSFDFAGAGLLTLDRADVLALDHDFGINGFVRFDDTSEGQSVFERAGAFGLHSVLEGGQPRLEFYVVGAGGERKRVLSTQVLSASTWYRFSAHLRQGQLFLTLGDGAEVVRGEGLSAVAGVATPLTFGRGLVGGLDQLEVFDLSAGPLAVFANQSTEIELELDQTGSAETVLLSTGNLQAPSGVRAAVLEGSGPIRVISIRTSAVTQEPNEDQGLVSHLWITTRQTTAQCLEGIGTGENSEVSGIGCDISISLVPPLEVPLMVRDLIVSGKNLVKGKASAATYIAGAVALIGIVARRFPLLGPALGRFLMARVAIDVGWAQEKLALKMLDASVEAAEGVTRTADEALVRIAAGEAGDEAKGALADVVRGMDNRAGPEAWDIIENIGKRCTGAPLAPIAAGAPVRAAAQSCFVPLDLIVTLRRLQLKYDRHAMLMLVRTLGRLDLPQKLSDDALEGMLLFQRHVGSPTLVVPGTPDRIVNIWKRDLLGVVPSVADPAKKLDQFFVWIKQGDQRGIPGWGDFLSKGPGTLPINSTAGAYNVLEHLAVDLGWSNIVRLEAPNGWRRFIDVVVRLPKGGVTREIRRELKNLKNGALFSFRGQVRRDIDAAIDRAYAAANTTDRAAQPFRAALQKELEALEYWFRGKSADMAALTPQLTRAIENALGKDLKHMQGFILRDYFKRTLPY